MSLTWKKTVKINVEIKVVRKEKKKKKLGSEAHACNSSTWEGKARTFGS